MASKYKVGDLVDIEFLDHAEDSKDSINFKLCGEILDVTKSAYIIATWRYACAIQRAEDDNNKENENRFAIVKKAIISIKKLK